MLEYFLAMLSQSNLCFTKDLSPQKTRKNSKKIAKLKPVFWCLEHRLFSKQANEQAPQNSLFEKRNKNCPITHWSLFRLGDRGQPVQWSYLENKNMPTFQKQKQLIWNRCPPKISTKKKEFQLVGSKTEWPALFTVWEFDAREGD